MIIRYNDTHKKDWNEFVRVCKNNHFFFYREYMDYHADRFHDHSLIFCNEKNKIIALLPANISNKTLYTHQGLTFGGLLIDNNMKSALILEIFQSLTNYCKQNAIEKIIYKCIPHIYHTKPAEEDCYALFRFNAKLICRNISSTILLDNKISYQTQRKRAVKKAIKNEVIVKQTTKFSPFWNLLIETLQNQHGVKPTHSLSEITQLQKAFPDNIKLFTASLNNEILAGTVIFENKQIVHTQYLASSLDGKKNGALDYILDTLINTFATNKKYLDLGISSYSEGKALNNGLAAQKEGFGARAIVHDFYEVTIK